MQAINRSKIAIPSFTLSEPSHELLAGWPILKLGTVASFGTTSVLDGSVAAFTGSGTGAGFAAGAFSEGALFGERFFGDCFFDVRFLGRRFFGSGGFLPAAG